MSKSRKKKIIWDTGPLMLFFGGHKQVKIIMLQIKQGKAIGYIPRLVQIEFYYKTWQKYGKQAAQLRSLNLTFPGMEVLSIQETEQFDIGEIKVKNPKLSIIDCRVVQLGLKLKGKIYTTDEEITKIKSLNVKKIQY